MLHAGSENFSQDYKSFMVQLGITMAHELVHCFVGMLAGSEEIDTPKELVGNHTSGIDCMDWGESGLTWEIHALGGPITAWREQGNELGERQSGSVWMTSNGHFKRVDIEAVAANINGMFANRVW
jgi:hypothetical protein